jgi:hypothetical protein
METSSPRRRIQEASPCLKPKSQTEERETVQLFVKNIFKQFINFLRTHKTKFYFTFYSNLIFPHNHNLRLAPSTASQLPHLCTVSMHCFIQNGIRQQPSCDEGTNVNTPRQTAYWNMEVCFSHLVRPLFSQLGQKTLEGASSDLRDLREARSFSACWSSAD